MLLLLLPLWLLLLLLLPATTPTVAAVYAAAAADSTAEKINDIAPLGLSLSFSLYSPLRLFPPSPFDLIPSHSSKPPL